MKQARPGENGAVGRKEERQSLVGWDDASQGKFDVVYHVDVDNN